MPGGTGTVIATIPLAEEAEKEEALNEALADLAFQPGPPLVGPIAAYSAGSTYAKGAYVEDEGIIYRSQASGNKGNTPHEDTDFVHWAPVGEATYVLQNSGFTKTFALISQHTYAGSPPARSDAAAPAAETISPGPEVQQTA
jgi:hypothetical protein